MKLSSSLLRTQREVPEGAETQGIQHLLRAGYVRRIGSGLYAHLPLMTRTMHKLEALIREELEGVSQEVSLPVLQPQHLWDESGRWAAYTQAEGIMFTVTDRAGRAHALGPTHEEVAVDVVRGLVRSYRDLPLSVYQIGRKFRDELRPRFGLLRTREFTMKDAYSFHADEASLREHFEAMSGVYARLLTRLGVAWRAVQADSGNIGGAESREFMVLSEVGEDEVLYTEDGRYAANAERAVSRAAPVGASPFAALARHHTPGTVTVASACAALGCGPGHMLKNVLYDAVSLQAGQRVLTPVLVSLRGDHSVNPVKLWNAVQARVAGDLTALEVAQPDGWAAEALPLGSLAPDLPDHVIARREGLHPAFLRLCDPAGAELRDFATGAGQTDWHVTGANWATADATGQFALPEVVELRQAQAGDAAVHEASQRLHSARGIEVGHVFQLGTRYAQAMGATFTGADGRERPFQMGCYGIGVTRLVQAVAEQCSDARGLIWPAAIAPYLVHLTVVDGKNSAQRAAADTLYAALGAAGLDPLLDDRDERAGVKFADADLIGLPYRVTVGRGVAEGKVEVKVRRSGVVAVVPVEGVVGWMRAQG
ncbi:proline--tRNA ligase [Deinococcus multiflagellatus]|uniref:Proline--tRNA ligase n=1 Tax=Deinococcus multiflagellatus TaxID=1656887 RepID=A0ABW1ZI34_9DEIO|nr:proline--tRNA ligase [Deinococcus multiflagellatus]MBZ9713119.1 proline--tRNA ligase [Deinococcus multiflagellatus]